MLLTKLLGTLCHLISNGFIIIIIIIIAVIVFVSIICTLELDDTLVFSFVSFRVYH